MKERVSTAGLDRYGDCVPNRHCSAHWYEIGLSDQDEPTTFKVRFNVDTRQRSSSRSAEEGQTHLLCHHRSEPSRLVTGTSNQLNGAIRRLAHINSKSSTNRQKGKRCSLAKTKQS
jgi:hypothetical protein